MIPNSIFDDSENVGFLSKNDFANRPSESLFLDSPIWEVSDLRQNLIWLRESSLGCRELNLNGKIKLLIICEAAYLDQKMILLRESRLGCMRLSS